MTKKIFAFIRNVRILIVIGCFASINIHAQAPSADMAAIKTVVIDAGHGGKDPGCHGATSQEKHVCLSMALKLGNLIKKKHPNIKVIYTRDTDVFVELDDRAKIANQSKADLFICIHANAAGASAAGTETYVLGLHKSESQQKIAERENSAIYLEDDKGEKYKDFDLSPDAIIARQLQLAYYLDQSILFASMLQAEFTKIGRYDRGVKQAGFLVLYKTTMPSVLIETGFLTNPAEEKFLSSEGSQIKMANSMFTAFESYKNVLEGITSKTENKPIVTKEIKEDAKINDSKSGNVSFKVQIETSDSKISLTDKKFLGVKVEEYQQDNLYKYTTGDFENDISAAKKLQTEMRTKGFQHAFVAAFMDGERISIEKAIKLAEK
ncbi:N-acetylmuramoyl-L-alanine amidase [Crocinitomicaceae bacterium]|nr:N-acetylmuramoyl-L-alanine amidase [Crocinitomicaceae bacterium]